MRKLILTICLFILLAAPVYAAKYVVDSTTAETTWASAEWTNYPDTPSCTPVTPATAMTNAAAGDTVYFRAGSGGTYTFAAGTGDPPTAGLSPSNSGSIGSYITFRNYPGETPWLQSSNSNLGALIGATSKDYIIWDGFKLSAASWSGEVVFNDADYCILRNSEIIGVTLATDPGGGGNYDGVRIQTSAYVEIYNNLIHGMRYEDRDHGGGVKLYDVNNIKVYNNTIYDTAAGIVDKSGGSYNEFYKNFIYDLTTDVGVCYGIVAAEWQAQGNPDNIQIYQNIIVQDSCSGANIKFDLGGTNMYAYNNTLIGNDNNHVGIAEEVEVITTTEIYNNITYTTTKPFIFKLYDDPPSYVDYNGYFDGQLFVAGHNEAENSTSYETLAAWQSSGELQGSGNPDVNSFYADPLFVDTIDYLLSGGSPAVGTGRTSNDMGAYPNGAIVADYVGYCAAGLGNCNFKNATIGTGANVSLDSSGATTVIY